jgi:hypothetical protein
MSLITGLKQRPSTVIATVLAFLVIGGIAIWHASRRPAEASSQNKQGLQNELRRGIGSEVHFAYRPEQAGQAVASAADFIHSRSGLKMSDEFAKKLAKAESDVLNGKSRYITIAELTDNMASVVIDRLATLTDEEIRQATEQSADTNGEIRSRADAKWGVMSKKDLIQQAGAGREWSRRGDSGLQLGLRGMIEEEVNDRVSTLSTQLPDQFGNASSEGLTPTQAFLIAYSVAMDDPLTHSRRDIGKMLLQKRMDEGITRDQRQAQKHASDLPYGPNGFLHPSGFHLFFTRDSVDKLLNLKEGGQK